LDKGPSNYHNAIGALVKGQPYLTKEQVTKVKTAITNSNFVAGKDCCRGGGLTTEVDEPLTVALPFADDSDVGSVPAPAPAPA